VSAGVRACVCVCVRACAGACVRACVRACMRACVCACVHACMRACVHACVHACVAYVRGCVCVCVRTHVCMYIHVDVHIYMLTCVDIYDIHIHMNTYIRMYIYMYAYTHTHTRKQGEHARTRVYTRMCVSEYMQHQMSVRGCKVSNPRQCTSTHSRDMHISRTHVYLLHTWSPPSSYCTMSVWCTPSEAPWFIIRVAPPLTWAISAIHPEECSKERTNLKRKGCRDPHPADLAAMKGKNNHDGPGMPHLFCKNLDRCTHASYMYTHGLAHFKLSNIRSLSQIHALMGYKDLFYDLVRPGPLRTRSTSEVWRLQRFEKYQDGRLELSFYNYRRSPSTTRLKDRPTCEKGVLLKDRYPVNLCEDVGRGKSTI